MMYKKQGLQTHNITLYLQFLGTSPSAPPPPWLPLEPLNFCPPQRRPPRRPLHHTPLIL